jgi:hypothetical protein
MAWLSTADIFCDAVVLLGCRWCLSLSPARTRPTLFGLAVRCLQPWIQGGKIGHPGSSGCKQVGLELPLQRLLLRKGLDHRVWLTHQPPGMRDCSTTAKQRVVIRKLHDNEMAPRKALPAGVDAAGVAVQLRCVVVCGVVLCCMTGLMLARQVMCSRCLQFGCLQEKGYPLSMVYSETSSIATLSGDQSGSSVPKPASTQHLANW